MHRTNDEFHLRVLMYHLELLIQYLSLKILGRQLIWLLHQFEEYYIDHDALLVVFCQP